MRETRKQDKHANSCDGPFKEAMPLQASVCFPPKADISLAFARAVIPRFIGFCSLDPADHLVKCKGTLQVAHAHSRQQRCLSRPTRFIGEISIMVRNITHSRTQFCSRSLR